MALELEVQLRDYALFLREEAGVIDAAALLVKRETTSAAPPPRRPRWLIAAATAAIALLVVGGLAVLIGLLRSETPVVDEPDPIVQTLQDFRLEDIPSFQATIAYRSGVLDNSGQIESAVEVSYSASEGRLRLEFIEDAVLSGDPHAKAGSYSIWDGVEMVSLDVRDDRSEFRLWGPARRLEPPAWNDWKERCGSDDLEILPAQSILGRETIHVRCVILRGEWELWVDAQTGLILRLNGSYFLGQDVALFTEDDGSFEIVSLEFIEPADELFDIAPPPGVEIGSEFEEELPTVDLPPFHLVVREVFFAESYESESGDEVDEDVVTSTEVWYESSRRWRSEVREASSSFERQAAGSFSVQMGSEKGRYYAADHSYIVGPETPWLPEGVDALVPEFNIFADGSSCVELEDDTYLGRPVSTFECPVPGGLTPETKAAAQAHGRSENVIFLIDQEFDLILFEVGPWGDREVVEVEFNPIFEPGRFEFVPPEGSRDLSEGPPPSPLIGQQAPALEASYLDGTRFDLVDLRGRRTVVMVWATWCAPCMDNLDDFESAFELWGDEIEFVAFAWQDEPANILGVAERGNLQVPVVINEAAEALANWQIEGIPWMALIDTDGTVIDVQIGRGVTGDLLGVIANASW